MERLEKKVPEKDHSESRKVRSTIKLITQRSRDWVKNLNPRMGRTICEPFLPERTILRDQVIHFSLAGGKTKKEVNWFLWSVVYFRWRHE